jgi:hypothetical protein
MKVDAIVASEKLVCEGASLLGIWVRMGTEKYLRSLARLPIPLRVAFHLQTTGIYKLRRRVINASLGGIFACELPHCGFFAS